MKGKGILTTTTILEDTVEGKMTRGINTDAEIGDA